MIGAMSMPANFPYKEVFQNGYPQHDRYDDFRIKHPAMDCVRRAKIFNAFDALKGFSEAIESKEVLYVYKRLLDEGEKEELNRRLSILHNLTINGRTARANRVKVSITYFLPCSDKENFAYGYRGQYLTITGIVWNVDVDLTHTITVNKTRIKFTDIVEISSTSHGDIFKVSGCQDSDYHGDSGFMGDSDFQVDTFRDDSIDYSADRLWTDTTLDRGWCDETYDNSQNDQYNENRYSIDWCDWNS